MTEKDELEYEMRPEYDFSNGRPNPYAARARTALGLVAIDPDLRSEFPTSEAVNRALRLVLEDSALAEKARVPQAKAS